MKKKLLIVFGILAIFFIVVAKPLIIHPHVSSKVGTPATPLVSVTLNSGSTVATVSGVQAGNAFQALSVAAKKQNLTLTTKQYDFGVFIEAVGSVANTKEKSWIYFVNGKSGTVAADKQNLTAGDSVEWKYMTPTFE